MKTVTVTSRHVGYGPEETKHSFTLPDDQADALYRLLLDIQTKACIVFDPGMSEKKDDTKYAKVEMTILPVRINLSLEEARSYTGPKPEKAVAILPINQDHASFIQNLTKLVTGNYALTDITVTAPSLNVKCNGQ